ncbi:dual specificity protein kinase CLK1-like [Calypte anna]|uniref:dual specificity protein kinase CLK1-like n=1 Tax=Calypte anna TaxID=9244 RepID=UPI0011C35A91|nr:dual specificity protein kinase CLK1-like [Calypte anna]XP_030324356.1 dual specificity protein kinase CLK1-like [Calypte anna]
MVPTHTCKCALMSSDIPPNGNGRNKAVKIVKDAVAHSGAAYAEVQVLDSKALDPSSTQHCVQMLDWFEYQGHVCIVFGLLRLSTYNFLKENCSLPFRLEHIRHMAYQICKAVSYKQVLHVDKLTHTDLNPENILLASSDYTGVQLQPEMCGVQTEMPRHQSSGVRKHGACP